MIDLKKTEGIYFIGIGGIGMSALALYFRKAGYSVAGYDRTESNITDTLAREGCIVSFTDNENNLPSLFSDLKHIDKTVVVYTPAIPADSRLLSFFRNNGYRIFKRSEILGAVSENTDAIAVAGTHGKTTVSTMTAHLLKQSHADCSAFLGGISKNYNSNLLTGNSNYTVVEADEFDRSFHRLKPLMAVVTSVDADHLDIYGDHQTMIEAYNEFCSKIRKGGYLIINSRIRDKIVCPPGVNCNTYGSGEGSDFRYYDVVNMGGSYTFSLDTPFGTMKDILFAFPGIINIENLTAAISLALRCGVSEEEIRKAAITFQGVKRRFDIRINLPGLTYIDDYAHHPEEIRAFIMSVREYFPGRKITGIFQPHLFSRTRDHAEGFAEILDRLDEVFLLPVYPAREKPIEGVSSGLILSGMKLKEKYLVAKEEVIDRLDISRVDVLVTIGAGDIDMLAGPIEMKLRNRNSE